MECVKCQKINSEEAVFCEKCGHQLKKSDVKTETESSVPSLESETKYVKKLTFTMTTIALSTVLFFTVLFGFLSFMDQIEIDTENESLILYHELEGSVGSKYFLLNKLYINEESYSQIYLDMSYDEYETYKGKTNFSLSDKQLSKELTNFVNQLKICYNVTYDNHMMDAVLTFDELKFQVFIGNYQLGYYEKGTFTLNKK